MKADREQGLARIHHLLDELSLPSALSQPTPRRFLMNSASSVAHFLIIWNDRVSPSQWRTWCGDQHLLDLFSTRTGDDSIRSVVTLNLMSGLLVGVFLGDFVAVSQQLSHLENCEVGWVGGVTCTQWYRPTRQCMDRPREEYR